MLRIQLRSVHASEDCVEVCLVISLQQEAVLVAMSVEVLDDLRMVDREGGIGAYSNPKEGHVLGSDYLVLLGCDLVEKGFVEELISDPDLLALVEGLEEMVQTAFFKCLFKIGYLILADRLELLEEGLDVVALLLQESFEEMSLGGL